MKMPIPVWILIVTLCGLLAAAEPGAQTASEILALERQVMDGWLSGNPDPALALFDAEITFFHVMTDKRLDGLPPVKALYSEYRGTPLFDSYEMIDPKVQVSGESAVLTYILARRNGTTTSRWNATQVYQRKKEGWRVIHSHWSMTKPPLR